MRYLLLVFIISTSYAYELEQEVNARGVGTARMGNATTEALMSYDFIVERSNYLLYRFKKLTFGEYADEVMILAPIISGQFELKAYKDINVFYNRNTQRGGFNYNINF